MLATSPRTAKNLLGGAITATRPKAAGRAGPTPRPTAAHLEDVRVSRAGEWGGAIRVAYTAQGTALFVALTMNKNEKGKTCASMHVWRSENGGESWLPRSRSRAAVLGPRADHRGLLQGKYSGRIYIGALYDYPVYRVGVFRSDDDGRTWTGPVEAANGGGTSASTTSRPWSSPTARSSCPTATSSSAPRTGSSEEGDERTLDGLLDRRRRTFSTPLKVVTQTYNLDRREDPGTRRVPQVRADSRQARLSRTGSTSPGRTRGSGHIAFSRPLGGPREELVGAPAYRRRRRGRDPVAAGDRREQRGRRRGHLVRHARLSGRSVSPVFRRVAGRRRHLSSDRPRLLGGVRSRGAGNAADEPMAMKHKDMIILGFISAAGWGRRRLHGPRRRQGRRLPSLLGRRAHGTFQIYTAKVKVEVPKEDGPRRPAAARRRPRRGSPGSIPVETADRQGRVHLRSDLLDDGKNELDVPSA